MTFVVHCLKPTVWRCYQFCWGEMFKCQKERKKSECWYIITMKEGCLITDTRYQLPLKNVISLGRLACQKWMNFWREKSGQPLKSPPRPRFWKLCYNFFQKKSLVMLKISYIFLSKRTPPPPLLRFVFSISENLGPSFRCHWEQVSTTNTKIDHDFHLYAISLSASIKIIQH